MTRKVRSAVAGLVSRLCADPQARLVHAGADFYAYAASKGVERARFDASLVRALVSRGLLEEAEGGGLAAGAAAKAWLTRQAAAEAPFQRQHASIEAAQLDGATVAVNRNESPVAALARKAGKMGAPWLGPTALAAAERLRRDFEIGGLQPRITSNWSATVNSGRRGGDGLTDLTDMAMAARLRFERAVAAVGPEFSGVLTDICCFLKGLEIVERERGWPARSAKLVLRLGLESLARHYGFNDTATGRSGTGKMQHWGDADYRPTIG